MAQQVAFAAIPDVVKRVSTHTQSLLPRQCDSRVYSLLPTSIKPSWTTTLQKLPWLMKADGTA